VPELPSTVDPKVFAAVQRCFCSALELDPDEVTYHSKILDDLGAESLDLLDVVFRLEKEFRIQIPRGGLETQAKQVDGEPGEVDGRLTEAGAAKMREIIPEVPASEIKAGMKSAELPKVFRVGTFYNLVVALVAAKQTA
jgi:acyl carrier protein